MTEIVEDLPGKGAFSQALDSTFRVCADEGTGFDLRLVELNDSSNAAQECFSLIFEAPDDAPAVQSTYHIKNEKFGAVDIFLVPIRKEEGHLYYEAVFNRFLNP
jgi:hypothetical protein